jgi:Ser/Thr protein kinase RdoA (MazF antagonist)
MSMQAALQDQHDALGEMLAAIHRMLAECPPPRMPGEERRKPA